MDERPSSSVDTCTRTVSMAKMRVSCCMAMYAIFEMNCGDAERPVRKSICSKHVCPHVDRVHNAITMAPILSSGPQ